MPMQPTEGGAEVTGGREGKHSELQSLETLLWSQSICIFTAEDNQGATTNIKWIFIDYIPNGALTMKHAKQVQYRENLLKNSGALPLDEDSVEVEATYKEIRGYKKLVVEKAASEINSMMKRLFEANKEKINKIGAMTLATPRVLRDYKEMTHMLPWSHIWNDYLYEGLYMNGANNSAFVAATEEKIMKEVGLCYRRSTETNMVVEPGDSSQRGRRKAACVTQVIAAKFADWRKQISDVQRRRFGKYISSKAPKTTLVNGQYLPKYDTRPFQDVEHSAKKMYIIVQGLENRAPRQRKPSTLLVGSPGRDGTSGISSLTTTTSASGPAKVVVVIVQKRRESSREENIHYELQKILGDMYDSSTTDHIDLTQKYDQEQPAITQTNGTSAQTEESVITQITPADSLLNDDDNNSVQYHTKRRTLYL